MDSQVKTVEHSIICCLSPGLLHEMYLVVPIVSEACEQKRACCLNVMMDFNLHNVHSLSCVGGCMGFEC